MFTGIVEQTGEITDLSVIETGRRLVLSARDLRPMPIGASIAVAGVCLTVVEAGEGVISVDVVPETLARTNLGDLKPGDRVNLERAMPADGRFDGHIVQGHVDGIGLVQSVQSDDNGVTVTIEPAESLLPYVVEKGSMTVDGVSLTVSGLGDFWFSVALIPHTLEVTTLGSLEPGDTVNLEVDVVAKYVERLLEARG